MIIELSTTNDEERVFFGKIARRWKPVRNPKSKYLVTEAEYPGDFYPDFVTGPSYLVSIQAALDIVPAVMEQKYIHLEDVFLTGVVAEHLGIARKHIKEFENNVKKVSARLMCRTLMHTITIHKVDPGEQADLFQMAVNPECGKRRNKDVFRTQPTKMPLNNMKDGAKEYENQQNTIKDLAKPQAT